MRIDLYQQSSSCYFKCIIEEHDKIFSISINRIVRRRRSKSISLLFCVFLCFVSFNIKSNACYIYSIIIFDQCCLFISLSNKELIEVFIDEKLVFTSMSGNNNSSGRITNVYSKIMTSVLNTCVFVSFMDWFMEIVLENEWSVKWPIAFFLVFWFISNRIFLYMWIFRRFVLAWDIV
jgi:hypothetical protein